jgi:hypothetical protein
MGLPMNLPQNHSRLVATIAIVDWYCSGKEKAADSGL